MKDMNVEILKNCYLKEDGKLDREESKLFSGKVAGVGLGIATSKAVEAVARQPEADSKITKLLIIGGALAEATAVYGLVIGLLIILLLK